MLHIGSLLTASSGHSVMELPANRSVGDGRAGEPFRPRTRPSPRRSLSTLSLAALAASAASAATLLQADLEVHASDPLGDYQRALAAGDVLATVAAFEPDVYVREPAVKGGLGGAGGRPKDHIVGRCMPWCLLVVLS